MEKFRYAATMQAILGILLPTLIFALIAFASHHARRLGRQPERAGDLLRWLVINVSLPCAVLITIIVGSWNVETLTSILIFHASEIFCLLLAYTISTLVFRYKGGASTAFVLSGAFGGVVLLGFHVIPLLQGGVWQAFSDSIMSPHLDFSFQLIILVIPLALFLLNEEKGNVPALRSMIPFLWSPVLIGVVFGVLWRLLGLPVPSPDPNAQEGGIIWLLQGILLLATPLSILAAGAAATDVTLSRLRDALKPGLTLAFIKFVVAPLFVYTLAQLVGIEPAWGSALVILACLPVTPIIASITRVYGKDEGRAAQFVAIELAVGCIILPIYTWVIFNRLTSIL